VLHSLYYSLKPYLPWRLRSSLRRASVRRVLRRSGDTWPIARSAGRAPSDWPGWPEGRQFAFVLTHDIEGRDGLDRVRPLAELEMSLGLRSTFNFIPEGPYDVPPNLRTWLTDRGFEVGVHDLHHDGKLYASRANFRRYAQRINHYLRDWNASGCRSGFMHHNLEWLHDLEVVYDASTFDTDPFEPQPDGVGTIFPFWVSPSATTSSRGGYLELPYTLPQDSTLFFYVGESDTQLWQRKLDWIAERGGMALLNVHPDYISLGSQSSGRWNYPPEFYRTFLKYVRDRYANSAWTALPREVARYVRESYGGRGPRQPRHIGMLTYSFFERDNRVLRYAKTLAARGDIVEVLSLREAADGGGASSGTAATAREPEEGKRILQAEQGSRILASESNGIRLHHVQGRRRDERRALDFAFRVLSFCWRSSRLLIRLQKLQRFDLIHVHNVPDFIVFATWFPRCRGARIILDLHDLLPEFYQSKYNTRTHSVAFKVLLLGERLSARFADHVIVSNHLWRDKVVARSARPANCSVFVNHVDAELFSPGIRFRSEGHPVLIFPGGFHHHQGLHVAIRAMTTLLKKFPTLKLHLIGDGPAREELVELASKLGLNGSVRILPPVPIHEIPLVLAQADLGVVPKLADGFGNEAYSTKIMEFMAGGLPVIASRTRIDEYYFGGGQVHFFRSGDSEDLARAVSEVLTNPELRAGLVRRGYEYVRRENWSGRSTEYLNLVDRLIESGDRPVAENPPVPPVLPSAPRALVPAK
jgi:glycosyltransferase involved in cell wall biosynthesis